MKRKFGKWYILIPIGLFINSGAILLTQVENTPDLLSRILLGVGTGLIGLPFILRKIKPTGC
ncbi:MAG: hypothetical protein ABI237_13260 [Ginsengibacter sp.]